MANPERQTIKQVGLQLQILRHGLLAAEPCKSWQVGGPRQILDYRPVLQKIYKNLSSASAACWENTGYHASGLTTTNPEMQPTGSWVWQV